MKTILNTIAFFALAFPVFSHASCPDLAGSYEGTCTETTLKYTRTFNWKTEIDQTACNKVVVSGWALSSVREIGVQLEGPDNFGTGPYYRATATYFFDSLMFLEVFGNDPKKPDGMAIHTFKKTSADSLESMYEYNSYRNATKVTMSCTFKRKP